MREGGAPETLASSARQRLGAGCNYTHIYSRGEEEGKRKARERDKMMMGEEEYDEEGRGIR